jgi:tetratricopeptide (TPR) repeat protein
METKSYARAVGDLDSVIKLNPRDAQGYYQRGMAYENAGNHAKAVEDYRTALSRNANLADAREALARITGGTKTKKTQTQTVSRDVDKPAADTTIKPDQSAAKKDAKPIAKGEDPKPASAAVASAPATKPAEKPTEKAAEKPAEAPAASAAVTPQQSRDAGRVSHAKKPEVKSAKQEHAPRAGSSNSTWVDDKGRPLSPREIAEIKRLMAPQRHSEQPVRYRRAGSTTFEDIWR